MIDYKDKIRKLLALSESPNEHEAKAALLKARELMATHKLTEADVSDIEERSVKRIFTDITYSKRRNPWINNISNVIGENYCCQAFFNCKYGKQTRTVGFIGLNDDVDLCVTIFTYAVDCVMLHIKMIKEKYQGCSAKLVNLLCNSFGFGFADGIESAFAEQNTQNTEEWGLALVIPKEVQEATADFRIKDFNPKAAENLSPEAFFGGYAEGKKFNPKRRLETEVVT